MPIQTKILFKSFLKALGSCAEEKNIYIKIVNKPGTGRRIELFKTDKDKIPFKMYAVHEAKYLYSEDLKKTCLNFSLTKEEFLKIAAKHK